MRLVAFLALALVLPVAAAQTHEHATGDGMAFVLHDGPDNGRAVVGGFTHFGFALMKDGVPQVHRNAQFQLVRGADVLFATEDTHEYDGFFSFDYTFSSPGPYTVMAMSDGMMMGEFNGTAVLPENETVAKVDAKVETTASSNVAKVTMSIVDAAGQLLKHTDAVVEFRSPGDDKLVARTHLHIHEAPIVFEQALPALSPTGADFTMRTVAYKAFATGKGQDLRAIVDAKSVHVGAQSTPVLPMDPGMPPVMSPMGGHATADGWDLYGMYDPQNQITVGFPIRLTGVIENATKAPKPHVDFDFRMTGPRGTVFSSKSLHEYDGVFEYLYVPEVPGLYDATLTAIVDETTKLSVPFHVQVLPPNAPLADSAGVGVVTLKGLEKAQAGAPTDLLFHVAGPAGPVKHSEVDVTIGHKGMAPSYQFKLHTHDSGDMKATVRFPDGGDWLVQVDASPTSPDPVVFAGPKGVGQPVVFAAKVEGVLVPASFDAPNAVKPKTVPGAALPVALAAFACAALALAARRTRK